LILSTIVAIGKNYQIGLNNKLLWHLPGDLAHFKKITMNHHMLMGWNTFKSIGKPLPKRISAVLTQDPTFKMDGVLTYADLQSAIDDIKARGESELFIIGGAMLYQSTIDLVDKIYLTRVDYDGEADTFFPKIDMSKWEVVQTENHEKGSDPYSWQFQELRRKR